MVVAGARDLGIAVGRDQAGLLARHVELLLQWNRRVNLTAIVDPREVAVKHVLDAIAPMAHIPETGRLLDMGTGGGFPGVPLKIMRPGQAMLLIDSVRKKINFVKHVIRELGLINVEARQIRAEDLGRDEQHPRFDVIVCRALTNLHQIVAWAHPLLAPGGRIVSYRGPEKPSDGESAPFLCDGVEYIPDRHPYRLPYLGDSRTVVVLRVDNS